MGVKFSPIGNDVMFFSTDGLVASGGQLFFYEANTSTKQNTYTTNSGAVANSNPIVLDSYGKVPSSGQIWLTEGQSYKVVLAPAADTDPPASGVVLGDYVTGINDTGDIVIDQWITSGLTPTYVSATQFTFASDQTSIFHVGRRIKTTNTGGTIYSTITASSYSSPNTTITVVNDSGTLDSGLSAVSYGLLSSSNPSVPKVLLPDGSTATTQTGGDNSTNIATTAYADTPKVVSVTTTPYTLLAGNVRGIHTCSGSAAAITMPAIAGVSIGNSFTIVNQLTTNITITRDGSSTFSNVNGSTTEVTLGAYSSVNLTKTSETTWDVVAFEGNNQQRVLASGSFTAAASLEFILSTLDASQAATNVYLLRMIGFQPSADDKNLLMTISSDAGSSYVAGTGYYGSFSGYDATGNPQALISAAAASIGVIGSNGVTGSLSNASDETATCDITFTNFNTGTSLRPFIQTIGSYWGAAASYYMDGKGSGSNTAAADYDAVKFTWESGGNFAAVGNYVLYKLR